ncbi:YueH family protein [Staphylococcus pasteuri]|uniref:YueH family protein n=1 Tax=Staphylococcus TaxID=1279 RepID=UPI001E450681|nr:MULTISPECIES: YueH family protein [Staphylococcus]MCE3021166.1 YueH family protein [Staphylococcus pasteuri]MCF7598738.1 YueH family protein [Staphylococcus pasteuri]MCO5358997.1 YueH family protein [Staphylococcus pasteuri]MDI3231107.1 YueH family protein [Staphylococcus pasteuri]MEB6208340.1 YueH family protein [Staphylococcus pasteuri]
MDQLKIREYTDDSNKFYVYFQKLNQTLLIAIPDQFWSVEISNDLSIEEINETLLMQFFTFNDENEAENLANKVTSWIETILKEND